jgi:membrane-bound metal-dependent hydrolase YbcI (DUF457 family)
MMGHTHWVIGAASWLGVLAFTPVYHNGATVFGGTAIAAVSALCADIDTKNSMASKALGPITGALSYLIRTLFGGHRKITHSILGIILVAACVYALTTGFHWPLWIEGAIMAGWASHVAADMITREGCPLLWPISKKKYGLHLVTTGKRAEKYLIRPSALIACIVFSVMLVRGL